MQARKALRESASKLDKDQLYTPLEAAAPRREVTTAKFDETVEVHFRLGIDTRQADQQVRGSVSLPARHRQDRSRRRLRRGRQGPRGRGRRRRHRRQRRPDREDPGRLPRLRRHRRHARHDEQGRQARQDPRHPRPHAEPEARHRHHGRRAGRQGAQGRQGRVPRRQVRHRARRHRQGLLHARGAHRELRRRARRDPRAKPASSKGKYVKSITMATTMGPGIKVDPTKTRNLLEEDAE